jgi:hypothetical protein
MALRVLKYLAGTSSYGITLGCANTNNQELVAFSDSDFAACLKTRKSVGGFILFFGNSPIIWSARKHSGVQALSSTEAELIQAVLTIREILWIQPMLVHLGYSDIVETSFLLADNQSAISNLKTEQTHGRTKHMDLRYKFCGEVLKLGKIKILYVRTEYNIADIFTKPLATVRYRNLRAALVANVSAILRDPTNAQSVAMHLREFLAQL